MMAALRPITDLWTEFYLGWALREIHPLHPDVPEIALARNEAATRTAGLRSTLSVKAALRPIGSAVARAARAFWRWC
jgi:hypothetical protein